MGVAIGIGRKVGGCALVLLSFWSLGQFEASAQERRQLLARPDATPRDFFTGRWVRYGDQFFPDEIVFEPDPAHADRLLVSFTMHCQNQVPSCSATKVQSDAAVLTGGASSEPMLNVSWFKDAAGNRYDVRFQMMPVANKLVKGSSKEINAIFSITPTSNRVAYFTGTEPNALRYYVTLAPASVPAPQVQPQRQPRLNLAPR